MNLAPLRYIMTVTKMNDTTKKCCPGCDQGWKLHNGFHRDPQGHVQPCTNYCSASPRPPCVISVIKVNKTLTHWLAQCNVSVHHVFDARGQTKDEAVTKLIQLVEEHPDLAEFDNSVAIVH